MEVAIKAGLAVVCYVAALLLFFHLFRKRTSRWTALFLSVVLAVPSIFPLYRFSSQVYLEESRQLLSRISEEKWKVVGGVMLACLALPTCYRILPRGYVQFWKIFGPPAEYQYRYIAAGQTLVGVTVAYFAWVGTDMALLFLFILLSAFAVVEYSRLMPLSKPLVSEVAKEWVEPATVGKWRVYLPGFLFLVGCISVLLALPNVALPSILILSISDSLASLIGIKLGHHKLPLHSGKSLEGTITFLVVSACILAVLHSPLMQILLVSVGVSLVEALSPAGLDNLTIPLSAALLLKFC
jgi:dolichol kinase